VAMCYGDLNGDAGLGELDSGTDVTAPAPTVAKSMRLEPDMDAVACKSVGFGQPWPWEFASAMFDAALMIETDEVSDELLMADAPRSAVLGCAVLERRSR
jgi:hypothetical protein